MCLEMRFRLRRQAVLSTLGGHSPRALEKAKAEFEEELEGNEEMINEFSELFEKVENRLTLLSFRDGKYLI